MRRRRNKRLYCDGEGWIYIGEKPGLFNFNRSEKKWKEYYCTLKDEIFTVFANDKKSKVKYEVNVKDAQFLDCVKRKKRPCSIRIVPSVKKHKKKKQKRIYVSTDSLKAIDEFKVDLEDFGACFVGSYGVKNQGEQKIERMEVIKWKNGEVKLWLKTIGMADAVKYFDGITGETLLELDMQMVANLGIEKKEAEKIAQFIKMMKKTGFFKQSMFVVQSKFADSFPGFSETDEFDDIVESLCDQSKIKHKFLSTADLTSHTLRKKEMTKDEAEQASITVDEEALMQLEKFDTARIHIKLVVTEVMQTSSRENLKKVLSPVISAVAPRIANKFQFFHTAIIVGPWYLEWTDSEIVIPKRMISGRAVISADVDTLVVKKEGLKEISDKISEVVVKWNTKHSYGKNKKKNLKLAAGNCQDFVDDILQALGLKSEFGGALGEFISKMRASGKASLEFSPCKDFREFFAIDKKSMVFDSHRELDEYCVRLKDECIDIEDVFASEWALLKSFDRAFWLRHLKDQEDPKYVPLPPDPDDDDGSEFCTGCVFKDPRETLSYR